jgi:hypothetical protein
VNPLRPEVGSELPTIQAASELDEAAGAKERALTVALVAREISVEEDGHLEVGTDLTGRRERRVARRVAVVLAQPHHRTHVERADARMSAVVSTHVD